MRPRTDKLTDGQRDTPRLVIEALGVIALIGTFVLTVRSTNAANNSANAALERIGQAITTPTLWLGSASGVRGLLTTF